MWPYITLLGLAVGLPAIVSGANLIDRAINSWREVHLAKYKYLATDPSNLLARVSRIESAMQMFARYMRSLEDENGLAPGLEAVVRAFEGVKP